MQNVQKKNSVPLCLCASVPSSNSGVALIIVLGLLTVMVLMAVTFAISMRTERLASGNNADNVRARELVHVGLARAMDDINALIQMHSCFVIDESGRIVLVRPNHDFQVGDEVRFFSPSNLPNYLVPNFVYKVFSKSEEYISVTSNDLPVTNLTVGNFNDRVMTNDSLPGPSGPSTVISGMRSYTLGTPIRTKSVPDLTQYVIPIDDFHIKLATSYRNALKRVANPLPPNVPDSIELQPLHGIYPVVTNDLAFDNQLVYKATRDRLRTGTAVRLEPPNLFGSLPSPLSAASVYYVKSVSNQVVELAETNHYRYIQLCDSYINAVADRPISITYALNDKVIIIPIQSVASSNLALVSCSASQSRSIADFSELVTVDSSLDAVNVTNHYHSGDAVAFAPAPAPLQEKNPYYVITNAPGKIQLANSIENALSTPPVRIDITFSSGSNRMFNLGLSGEAVNYFPMAVFDSVAKVLAASSSNVFVGINASTNGELMGKVRYAMADCSGLLDANFVGGDTRNTGVNPREFQLANLPESAGSLPAKRDVYKRYETFSELVQNLNYYPSDLFVYSSSRPEQWDCNLMNLQKPINIGGNLIQLQNQKMAITNALWLAGVTSIVEAGIIYSNLLDYVDDNLIPANFEFSVENVPMINEVVVSNLVIVADENPPSANKIYTVKTDIIIECWYPFVVGTSVTFDVVSSTAFGEQNNIKPDNPLLPTTRSIGPPLSNGFFIITNNYSKNMPPVPKVSTMKLISTNYISIKLGSDVVDQLNNPIILTNNHVGTDNIGTNSSCAAAECLDPRFNANSTSDQWRVEVLPLHTLNDTNTWTKSFMPSSFDGDTAMFVANKQLSSVAELGYLAFAPWRTVKLYGPDRIRVLDVFAIATDPASWFATNRWNRGQINPNTKSLDVMKAWFQGMSVDKYPGQTVGATPLGSAEAQTVAQLIVDQSGSYTNLSDLGRVLDNYLSGLAGKSELEKESYFRNTCGLFNIHQNVFAILIEAKAASGGNIPRNPAKQRAVAIVWRDPFTGEMFVRHVKWLGD